MYLVYILQSHNCSYIGMTNDFFRRWQRAGINWRTSTDLWNYIHFFANVEVPVSVASPRMAKSSVVGNLFSKVSGKEYIIGHMPYSDGGKCLVEKYISKTITIVRDPRDMALSMLSHIRERPLHMAYSYLFNQIQDDQKRLEAIVKGYENEFGYLVGLNEMYSSMLLWGYQQNNLILRFEDLVGKKGGGTDDLQFKSVKAIAQHIGILDQFSNEKISSIGSQSFGKTTTFRKGQIGRWVDLLNKNEKYEVPFLRLLKLKHLNLEV